MAYIKTVTKRRMCASFQSAIDVAIKHPGARTYNYHASTAAIREVYMEELRALCDLTSEDELPYVAEKYPYIVVWNEVEMEVLKS